MLFDVRWLWHPLNSEIWVDEPRGRERGWWQAVIVTHEPLRWQFVALVEFNKENENA